MHWLPLAILLSFGFGQLFKWSQRRGCWAPAVVSINYLVLALVLLVYFALDGGPRLSAGALEVGLLTGCAFIVSMLIMTRALELTRVGSVLTAFRLAILLPIAAAVWLWGESASLRQWAGIGLALLSLVLMTRNTSLARLSGEGGLLLLLLVFLLQGLSQVCLRWVHYAGLDPERLQVLMVTALTAGLLGLLYILISRRRPSLRDLSTGTFIGLFNLVCLAVILTALSHVQGTLFFPLTGCAVVVMDNLFAHFYWKETLGRMALAGAGLGAFSMLLIM